MTTLLSEWPKFQISLISYFMPGSRECERVLLSCWRLLKIRCDCWFRICCWTIVDWCCWLKFCWCRFCWFWLLWFKVECCCCRWRSFMLLLWLLSNLFWARGLNVKELTLLWISWEKQWRRLLYNFDIKSPHIILSVIYNFQINLKDFRLY